jgi:hypothetical protein
MRDASTRCSVRKVGGVEHSVKESEKTKAKVKCRLNVFIRNRYYQNEKKRKKSKKTKRKKNRSDLSTDTSSHHLIPTLELIAIEIFEMRSALSINFQIIGR